MKDSDCYASVVLPFEGVQRTLQIQLMVTEAYPGDKFDDMCISEVSVF